MKNTLFILLLMLSVSAYAQDKKAITLLNEVSEKTQSFDNIKIRFEYKMLNKSQGINESLDGWLLSKGDKYKLDVAGQQIISDGKTMWTFMESVNEVQINEPMNDEEGFNPRNFLKSWADKFKAKILSESGNEVVLELLPKEAAAFNKVHVKVDKNKKQLLAITMFDGTGNEFVYAIKDFITNESIPDSSFRFNPADHPGIEVIDLR
ncbi:MAG: outer membrane lipoprotein carrier protein LolA [Bacteroidales bacterium]|nr:outer membrane lipoprotein carrier protein LolA [Bacteroidales bacterium]